MRNINASEVDNPLRAVGGSWGWILAFGVLTTIAGIVVVSWPGETLLVIAVLLGIQIVISGIFRLVASFAVPGEAAGARVLLALIGLLSIGVGIICLRNVIGSLEVLAIVIGVFWILHGLVEIMMAISDPSLPRRGLVGLIGAIGMIAGIVIIGNPGISLVTLAWISGFWLIVYGIAQIFLAFRARAALAASP